MKAIVYFRQNVRFIILRCFMGFHMRAQLYPEFVKPFQHHSGVPLHRVQVNYEDRSA